MATDDDKSAPHLSRASHSFLTSVRKEIREIVRDLTVITDFEDDYALLDRLITRLSYIEQDIFEFTELRHQCSNEDMPA